MFFRASDCLSSMRKDGVSKCYTNALCHILYRPVGILRTDRTSSVGTKSLLRARLDIFHTRAQTRKGRVMKCALCQMQKSRNMQELRVHNIAFDSAK